MSIDPRMMLQMQACEVALHQELAGEVVHVPLTDYQPGSPHYERLLGQMAEAQKHQFPTDYGFNF